MSAKLELGFTVNFIPPYKQTPADAVEKSVQL